MSLRSVVPEDVFPSDRTGSGKPRFRTLVELEKNALVRRFLLVEGHFATLTPFLLRRFFPSLLPVATRWATTLQDADVGDVRISGLLRPSDGDDLLIVVHGLGGSVQSGYMGLALRAADALGMSCLLLNVRGADHSGEDIPHAGLYADLVAAVGSPAFAGYKKIYVLGYSLGGHLALSYAVAGAEPRVKAVAALCAPLDLEASARAFDAPYVNLYRGHVLKGLGDIYAATHARRGGPIEVRAARSIRRIRDWDERIVAPRFGFTDAADYYNRVSVGPKLGALELPALYVGAYGDPMVPYETVRGQLEGASSALEVHWSRRGGHLGLPATLDLGFPGSRGLEAQVLAWLRDQA